MVLGIDPIIEPEVLGFIDVLIGVIVIWILFSINKRFSSGEFKRFTTWLLIMITISSIRILFISTNEIFQFVNTDTRFLIGLTLSFFSLSAGLKAALELRNFARIYGQMDIEKFVKPYRIQK